jgi:hypothetical protein
MDTNTKKSKRRLRLPQVRLLRALADGSQLSRGELGNKAGFSAISGTVSVALNGRTNPPQKGLVALGMVRRLDLPTSEDGKLPRETVYEITARGREALERAEKRLPPLRDKDASTNKRYLAASTQASQSGVTLADLIGAGLLNPPLKLFRRYKGTMLEARLVPDGKVEFQQHVYDTCSAAGEAARKSVTGKRHNTNGWTFWQYQDADGKKLQLRDARSQLEPPPSEGRHAGDSA